MLQTNEHGHGLSTSTSRVRRHHSIRGNPHETRLSLVGTRAYETRGGSVTASTAIITATAVMAEAPSTSTLHPGAPSTVRCGMLDRPEGNQRLHMADLRFPLHREPEPDREGVLLCLRGHQGGLLAEDVPVTALLWPFDQDPM